MNIFGPLRGGTTSEPKYVIISRIPNDDAPKTFTVKTTKNGRPIVPDHLSLTHVNPFLISKTIQGLVGEVNKISPTAAGTLLIQTRNSKQADTLIEKLTQFSNSIKVKCQYHHYLNTSKGVIYCNALRDVPEEEIIEELKPYKVTEAIKIRRKHDNSETGLIILTFNSSNKPDHILVGYLRIEVRPHIPNPMRCNNCWSYDHRNTKDNPCKLPKRCYNCSKLSHVGDHDKCFEAPNCLHCAVNATNPTDHKHSVTSRFCPIFLVHKEINTIRITEKVSRQMAVNIFEKRSKAGTQTTAEVVKGSPSTTNEKPTTHSKNIPSTSSSTNPSSNQPSIPTTFSRKVITYDDPEVNNHIVETIQNSTIITKPLGGAIVAKIKTNRRDLLAARKLAKKAKSSAPRKSPSLNNDSENSGMES